VEANNEPSAEFKVAGSVLCVDPSGRPAGMSQRATVIPPSIEVKRAWRPCWRTLLPFRSFKACAPRAKVIEARAVGFRKQS
jgi:hypothetical protein